MILLFGAAVAILQALPVTSMAAGADTLLQRAVILACFFVAAALFVRDHLSGKLTTGKALGYMLFGGMLLRVYFVLFNDILTLQNDTGTYTGFGTDGINIGHLGYIEYIYKFFKLPDMDPYEVFGYFHPPVHHIIEALWLTLQRFIGVQEPLAFENLQVPTLIYSGLCMLVMLHILLECGAKGKRLLLGMLLFCYQPRMMILAGSVNNDILALLLLLTTIWRTLAWIRDKSYKNTVLLALSLGFAMITKLNTAICAITVAFVFVICLISALRSKNLVLIRDTLIKEALFTVICAPIGLSFILRNLIVYGKKPGLPTQGTGSVMYMGNYAPWEIVGIPMPWDLRIDFPFHPISAEACHNGWVILFQTAMFAEGYPADLGEALRAMAGIAYVAAIIVAVVSSVVFIVACVRKVFGRPEAGKMLGGSGAVQEERVSYCFLLVTFMLMLVSFVLYLLKYPYTCSGDFRYMAATLVFVSLGFSWLWPEERVEDGGRFAGIVRFMMGVAMAASLIFAGFVILCWQI